MGNKKNDELSFINPDAAGIDVGSEEHYVCVPEGRSTPRIQTFKCFTEDLHRLANWLKSCGIKTVAMESTGVYWIPLFQILETRGFEVKLVNAKHVKNVPGRKSDVKDCQWLQQLHSYGLLQGSFRPDDPTCMLRSYIRQRETLIQCASTHVNRMQKALTQMNIQLHKVIADITGLTGLNIIKSILAGERDPEKLAALRNHRVKNDSETIAKALVGDWREEHLFTLKQEFELYEIYRKKIDECDQKIENHYQQLDTKAEENKPVHIIEKKHQKNHPNFNLREELYRITGVDFTKVPGFDVLVVQTILSEIGLDSTRWATEKHFVSWLGLSPTNTITGGKVISTNTRKVKSRAAKAFRLAAYGVAKSKSALGGYCRRLKARLGSPQAITATARKLACIFYNLLKYGSEYVEKGLDSYEKSCTEKKMKNLSKKAKELGFVLVKQEVAINAVS
jgi:transposase